MQADTAPTPVLGSDSRRAAGTAECGPFPQGFAHSDSRPSKMFVSPASGLSRLALALVAATTALLFIWYAWTYVDAALRLVAFPFDVDQGEGYDTWSGWLLNLGQLPYSDNQTYPYYSSSYPPLWSYLVSIPMAWLGPSIGAARAVSALAAVLSALTLAYAATAISRDRLAGIAAALLFLGSTYVFHTTPLARVNSTALLFSVLGLALYQTPTRRRVVWGTLALLAALLTKPTAVDAVAAGIGFLLLRNRRVGIATGATLATLVLACYGVLLVLTGGSLWTNTIISKVAIPFVPELFSSYLGNFLETHGPLLLLALLGALLRDTYRRCGPWPVFLLTSGILCLMSIGKSGSGESYFLSLIAACSVLVPVATLHLVRGVQSGEVTLPTAVDRALARLPLAHCLAVLALTQAILFAHGPISTVAPWLRDRGLQASHLASAPSEKDLQAGQAIVESIRSTPGPVLVEDSSFAIVARKQVVGNAAHLRDLYHARLWDPSPLVSDLHARRYDVVVLNAERYPEPVLAAIGRAYYLARTVPMAGSTYYIFLPGAE